MLTVLNHYLLLLVLLLLLLLMMMMMMFDYLQVANVIIDDSDAIKA